MTRAPAAIMLGLALSASATAGAEPCAPRAELAGDPAAVARVARELARLGVAIGAADAGCRSLRARVELDGGSIAVAIVDDTRRSEGRVVSDPALAAAWIDSWLRDELDDAWAQIAAQPPVAVRADPPSRSAPTADAAPAGSVFDRGALGVSYEQTFTSDPESWSGISGNACVRFGWFCVGARARYARESGLQPVFPTTTRNETSVVAVASTAFELGRMSIAPELGAGVGRIATERTTTCKDPEAAPGCDPSTDPSCKLDPGTCLDTTGVVVPVGGEREHTYAPRLTAALRIAVPVFDHVWLEGIASATYAPLGHFAPFRPADQGVDADKRALPGEPRTMIQLGIGLRVGSP